jgi:hypothetical protein
VNVDYLLGWLRGGRVPPLVVGSSSTDEPAVIGQPGTSILYGNERINDEVRSGVRATVGCWLDCEQTCGVEARFFWLDPNGGPETFGGANVGRPFINTDTGQPDSELVDFDVIDGTVTVDSESPMLGADLVMRKKLCCGCCYRVDCLFGYRFLSRPSLSL